MYMQPLSPEKLELVIEFLKKRLSKVCGLHYRYAHSTILIFKWHMQASADDSQTFNLEVVGQVWIVTYEDLSGKGRCVLKVKTKAGVYCVTMHQEGT